MKRELLRGLIPSTLIVLGATTAFAFIEPSGERLGDFDGRSTRRAASEEVSNEQQVAAAELRSRLPKARVDFDQRTGAPRRVSAGDSFLTSAIGQSQAAAYTPASSTGAAAAVVVSDPDQPARTFLQEHRSLFGHGAEALDQARVVRAYVTPHNGMRTVVWQQQVDDIPVFEAVLVAHTTKRGELINLSSGFVPDPIQAANVGTPNRAAAVVTPPLTDRAAVVAAARNLGETITESEVEPVAGEAAGAEHKQLFQTQALPGQTSASLVWLPLGRGELRLCWDVVATSRLRGEMFQLLVDAQTGEVLLRRGLTRYISDASYRVYTSDSPSPFSPGHSTPLATQPSLTNRSLVTWPAMNTNASPNGWINDGVNETMGNNVDAHTDRDINNSPDLPRPAGSPNRVFDFAMDLGTEDPINYSNAAVVQLFYLCNWYHDRLYELGFTEAAGNFQINNFGRGGVGNDAVQADAQDGGGFNNANFSTPPDGSSGRMQMYIFSGPSPRRDGDFDAEIVFHEYTHGLSTRLVGGGLALKELQSMGLGEGWSDFYGLSLLSEPGDNVNGCYAAGGYATYLLGQAQFPLTNNYYFGIRRYPYSTDMTKNPLTFKDIDPAQASPHNGIPRSSIIGNNAAEVHNQGEVWCVTLWEARANLISKHGWAVGNELMLQLATDGMKLTPGEPNFLEARDGILQADLVNNAGANHNELWAAFAKRGMGISATSPFSTTTSGVVEAYDAPDYLFIVPNLLLTSDGPVGGPFTPNPTYFVLTNTGSASLNWSLVNTSTWVTMLPASGTLQPSGPATTVTVTISAVARDFSLGTHTANLLFTNQTSAVVQARTLRLNIVCGMFDDFDPNIDLTQWSAFGGSVGSTVLANNTGGSFSAPNSLWFGDGGSRYATTIPIDASGGGSVSFWLRLGNALSPSPWETVDLPDEGVVLEYSTNGGGSWVNIVTCDTSTFYSWTQVSSSIPVGARTSNTLFRWRQLSNSGTGLDHWALDDVRIDATPTSTLALSMPTIVTEGNPPQTGTVIVSPAPASDLTVALLSSDVSEVTVPSSVIVLSGSSNVTFDITIVDDGVLDGPQTAYITASASARHSANAVITVADNETATLSLSLPGNTSESSGSVTGIVSVSTAPTANILVGLSSSDTTELQVPATVVLSSGQISASFIANVINDTLIDGPQNVTVTAHVANWTNGQGSIAVLDNETANLTVNLPASAYENVGVLAGAGQVRLSGSLPTNLVVSLLSSDTTEATVPATTTVFAGQTNSVFNLTLVDDAIVDGAKPARITASAPGFNSGSNTLSVLDDDTPPLPTNPLPTNWATNVAANTFLTWSNGLAGVTNDVYFGMVAGAGQLKYLGSTTGTNWSLPLLAPNTTYYWRIVVNRVGTTIGPVWRFTTRGVDHFVWDTIPSPQYVNTPFLTQITAKDDFGTTVSNFTGTVSLNDSEGGGQTTILGNVSHTTTGSGNYTLAYAITPNTNLTVTHVRSYAGSKVSIWSAAGTLLASQNVGGMAGNWTETPLATPQTLTAGTTYRISFFISGGTYYYRNDRPATFPHGSLVDGYYYRIGDGFPDSFYDSDKVIYLCDLRYITEGSLEVPITPTVSGSFVDGAWVGNVAVLATKSSLTLRAADASGRIGVCNPFEAVLANDVAVTVSDAPDPITVGGDVTYLITVTNVGPAAATGVVVTNLLPATVMLGPVSSSQGSSTTNGSTVRCNLGSLAANASATVTIVVKATTVGSITNLATVSRAEPDSLANNNSATVVTSVVKESTGIVAYFTDNSTLDTGWAAPIARAGFIPLLVSNIATFPLTNSDMLLINEDSNSGITSALQARLPAIQTWVSNGGKLVVHDRSFGSLADNPFLLGTTGIPTMRLETSNLDVIPPGTNLVVAGPHGQINNTNLDGGEFSAHGCVAQDQLPAEAEAILSGGGVLNNVVCFAYPLGSGLIYYSSIPLDCYLAGSGCAGTGIAITLQTIYAPNVLAYVSGQIDGGSFPPSITSQPVNQSVVTGGTAMFEVTAFGSYPLSYQWYSNSGAITGATNNSHVISGAQTNDAGNFSVVVANSYGAVTSAVVALTVIDLPLSAEFRIVSLTPNNSYVVDHDVLTGDDHGGIAASSSQVFYSGDNATARFSAANLTGGTGLNRINDGMVSDLRTEQMYHLANGTNLLTGAGTVTTLVALGGNTGLPTGIVIPLSAPVTMSYDSGIFAGYGRVALHNGSRVFEVLLPSGQVVDRGAMTMPAHSGTESWAFWGVVENYGGSLYLVYVQDSTAIARTEVPTGFTTNLGSFSNLSDMACLTVSVPHNRWYFHYEGSGQFGGFAETLGYADATFSINGTSNPPVILTQPSSKSAYPGGSATFEVSVAGDSPLFYQWLKDATAIPLATNAILTLLNVQPNDDGSVYSVMVTNACGSITSSNAMLTVNPTVALNALLIWDINSGGTLALSNAFAAVGVSVTLSATDETGYTGVNPSPAGFGAIIHLNGTTYSADMPLAGQIALSNYVYSGGGYLHGEWDAYEFGNNAMARMRDLILFDRNDGSNGTVTLTTVAGQEGHPVLANLPPNFAFQAGYNIGPIHTFSTNPATVLMRDADGSDAVAVREFGAGRIVGFHNAGNYGVTSGLNTLTNPYVQQLYINGLVWAAKVGEVAPAPLRFVSTGQVGGALQFWLGTTDGSLIASNRAARIQFYSTSNFDLPFSSWLRMTNPTVLTNGMLRVEVSDFTNFPVQLLQARETL